MPVPQIEGVPAAGAVRCLPEIGVVALSMQRVELVVAGDRFGERLEVREETIVVAREGLRATRAGTADRPSARNRSGARPRISSATASYRHRARDRRAVSCRRCRRPPPRRPALRPARRSARPAGPRCCRHEHQHTDGSGQTAHSEPFVARVRIEPPLVADGQTSGERPQVGTGTLPSTVVPAPGDRRRS